VTPKPDEQGVRDNADLIAEGWKRRHLAEHMRAIEAKETYEAAGFEVHLQKLAPSEAGDACRDCVMSLCASYLVIYTRKLEKP
jgi:hypothetical protein